MWESRIKSTAIKEIKFNPAMQYLFSRGSDDREVEKKFKKR